MQDAGGDFEARSIQHRCLWSLQQRHVRYFKFFRSFHEIRFRSRQDIAALDLTHLPGKPRLRPSDTTVLDPVQHRSGETLVPVVLGVARGVDSNQLP